MEGCHATETVMLRLKHELNSVGSLKWHRQDAGAGRRSRAQADEGTQTHGQTKKKMKSGAGGGSCLPVSTCTMPHPLPAGDPR